MMTQGVLYAGIDEAGYGPRLGPLCIGLSIFRVHSWCEGDAAPDLWSLLSRAVSRGLRDKRDRIAFADSKKLKLSNQSKTRHPLTHLERGVLAMLGAGGSSISSDTDLFDTLGVELEPHDWYATDATRLPLAREAGSLQLDSAQLRRAMADSGVELVSLRCIAVGEASFNAELRERESKGAVVAEAVRAHLERVVALAGDSPARVICDRLSGRMRYAELLERTCRGEVRVLEESARCSRYAAGSVGVQFLPEGERKHLPVALASMVAKLVRELAMIRFNRYWATRNPQIKPTAGYWQDANRWLSEMDKELSQGERQALVRLA